MKRFRADVVLVCPIPQKDVLFFRATSRASISVVSLNVRDIEGTTIPPEHAGTADMIGWSGEERIKVSLLFVAKYRVERSLIQRLIS